MPAYTSAAEAINSISKQMDSADQASSVVHAIKMASNSTGVDFSYMMKKASQESGFDASAVSSSSSATGLYQFTSQTWLHMVKDYGDKYGLENYAAQITKDSAGRYSVANTSAKKEILAMRKDPALSAMMSGELDKENAAALKRSVGGKIGHTELYLAHFLGAYGASNFIKQMRANPDTKAADLLPTAAAANQSVFYTKDGQARTVQEVYQKFAQKFDGVSSKTQFADATSSTSSKNSSLAAANNTTVSRGQNLLTGLYPSLSVASNATNSGFGGASGAGASMTLAGDSTLFAALMMGQLSGINSSAATDAYTADKDENRNKSAISVISAVV